MEPMTIWPEVWPVAADETGVYLLGRDAWRPRLPISADGDPHADVELVLHGGGVRLADVAVLHSTSWRAEPFGLVVTYVAVIRCRGVVAETWPDAAPIGVALAREVGRPPTHGSAEAPLPRRADVLMHALRHLRYLMDENATTRDDLPEQFRRHLEPLAPALAAMYQEKHQPKAA